MKRWRRGLLTSSLALLVMGCATYVNPLTGRTESVLIPTSQEIVLGRMAAAQLQQETLLAPRPAPAMVHRVEQIGQRIAAVADRRDVTYQYHVIQDKAINAFTMLGGDVYVFSGLVSRCTDDELACVLAHETGHVVERHGVKALQAQWGYDVVTQAAFGGRATAATQVLDTMFMLVSRGYSREHELQADALAIRYAARAGFDPHGMVTFLQALQRETGEGPLAHLTVYLQTHPLYRDRIAQAEAEIARLASAPSAAPRATEVTTR